MDEESVKQGYYRIHVQLRDGGRQEDRIQVDYYKHSDNGGALQFIKGTVSSSPVEIRVFTVYEYKKVKDALASGNVVELSVGHVIDSGCDGLAINRVEIRIRGVRKWESGTPEACKIQGWIEECPPLKFIPISNNSQLEVRAGKQSMGIQVVDRKQGSMSIAYTTTEVRLSGVDLRAYGHLIEYTSRTKISVQPTGGDYFLLVSGVNLQIEGLRTVDVSEVRIKSKGQIKVSVNDVAIKDRAKPVCLVSRMNAFLEALCRVPWCLCALLACCILWVVVMTALPMFFWSPVVSEVQRQVAQLPQVKVEETTTSAPALQHPKELKVRFRTLGYGALCVWFVLAAGVYLVLYFLGVIALVLSCRAVRRHRKLNGDISGVIAALRAERDKTARDRMKKRILDNLLSTYLGERSED